MHTTKKSTETVFFRFRPKPKVYLRHITETKLKPQLSIYI